MVEINRRQALKIAAAGVASAVVPGTLLVTREETAIDYAHKLAAHLAGQAPYHRGLWYPDLGMTALRIPWRSLLQLSAGCWVAPEAMKDQIDEIPVAHLVDKAVTNGLQMWIHYSYNEQRRMILGVRVAASKAKQFVEDSSLFPLIDKCASIGFDKAREAGLTTESHELLCTRRLELLRNMGLLTEND
jgi:hypothetical protein